MAKNWAIAIGINEYDNLKSLKYAKRDAEAIKAWCVLLSRRIGLCEQKEIEMIVNLLKEESRMIISLIKNLEN